MKRYPALVPLGLVICSSIVLAPVELGETDIASLLAFLHALTDPAAHDLRGDLPASVPSGDLLAD